MNKDQIAGEVKKVGGEAREGVAKVTGDKTAQAQGLKDQATGTAQKAYGDVKDAAKKASNA